MKLPLFSCQKLRCLADWYSRKMTMLQSEWHSTERDWLWNPLGGGAENWGH